MQTDRITNRQTDKTGLLRQRIGEQTKNCQGTGSANSGAYLNSGADSACGLSVCGLDRSAYGLATSVSTQLWAWPNVNYANLCIYI